MRYFDTSLQEAAEFMALMSICHLTLIHTHTYTPCSSVISVLAEQRSLGHAFAPVPVLRGVRSALGAVGPERWVGSVLRRQLAPGGACWGDGVLLGSEHRSCGRDVGLHVGTRGDRVPAGGGAAAAGAATRHRAGWPLTELDWKTALQIAKACSEN